MIVHKIIKSEKKYFIFWVFVSVAIVGLLIAMMSPVEAAPRKRKKVSTYNAPPYSAIVVDAKTGKILYGDRVDEKRYPASVTKVMTLYLLFEQLEAGRLKFDTRLKVSSYAASQAPSKIGLRAGETISVKDAIEALVTKSANDAAVVVAEAIGGSEKQFASMMTNKARALGMKNTVFRNPHGLPNNAQYTTARDLSILGRAIQDRFPVYYRFFQTRYFTYKNAVYPNHNKLLGRIEGVDGIKTGYTNASGFNLLTNVKTDNRHIVAVVLGGRSGFSRDQAMTQLIGNYLPIAYAGKRTAPYIKDQRSVQMASADISSTGSLTAESSPARNPGEPLKLNNLKAVVTAASDAPAVVTPSFVDPGVLNSKSRKSIPDGTFQFASLPIDSSGNVISAKVSAQPVKNSTGTNNIEPTKTETLPPVEQADATIKGGSSQNIGTSRTDGWIIQLAATGDERSAKSILNNAKNLSGKILVQAEPFTEKFERDGSTFYRARFSGFSERKDALSACSSLKKSGFSCFASRG